MGIGEVVDAFPFEHERPFNQTLRRQVIHGLRFALDFQHVRLQPGDGEPFPRSGVKQIGAAVLVDEHDRIDSAHALDGSSQGPERSVGLVRDRDSYLHSAALRHRRKIEVILAVLEHAVRRPHGVSGGVGPLHARLGEDHAVILPVREVLRREDVVILHDEPVRAPLVFRRRLDVVRRIDVDLPLEHACRRVGGELVHDQGIGRECSAGKQQSRETAGQEAR